MKKNKIVLIPIESFKRDALSRIFFGSQLNLNGIDVIIGPPMVLLDVILPSVSNPIWIGRFISLTGDSSADNRLLNTLKKQNGKIYYLHDEGAFYADDNYESSLHMLHNAKLMNDDVVQYVLVWGECQKQILEKAILGNKILVSGMYRFDLLKPLKAINKDLKIKYGKNYTLINTRFPEANTLKGEVGIFDNRTLSHYLNSNYSKQYGLDDMFAVWAVINESFSHFVYAIYRLISKNPDRLFVIRPHPAESPKFYKNAFCYFDNVIIDNEENISDHILSAELIIHNECTTGIEAIIAGKPTINFVSTKTKNIVGTSSAGILVSKYEDLLKSYNDFKSNNLKKPEIENKKYLINLSNNFYSSDYIINILKNQVPDSTISLCKLCLKWDYYKLKSVIKHIFFIPLLRIIGHRSKLIQYSFKNMKNLVIERNLKELKIIEIFDCVYIKKK